MANPTRISIGKQRVVAPPKVSVGTIKAMPRPPRNPEWVYGPNGYALPRGPSVDLPPPFTPAQRKAVIGTKGPSSGAQRRRTR